MTLIFFSSPNVPRPLPTADWVLMWVMRWTSAPVFASTNRLKTSPRVATWTCHDQHVRRAVAALARQDEQLGLAIRQQLTAGQRDGAGARLLHRERGRGVDRDVRMDRAEDGDRLRAVALAHELRAEDARRAVVLIEAIVGAALHHRVGPALGEAQRARVGEAPDLAIPVERRVAARGRNVHRTRRGLTAGRGRHRDQRETERPASKRPRHERERTPPLPSCMELHA